MEVSFASLIMFTREMSLPWTYITGHFLLQHLGQGKGSGNLIHIHKYHAVMTCCFSKWMKSVLKKAFKRKYALRPLEITFSNDWCFLQGREKNQMKSQSRKKNV
jgi:hypothetical protein